MYCLKCGKQVTVNSKFCSYCGSKLVEVNNKNQQDKNTSELLFSIVAYILAGLTILLGLTAPLLFLLTVIIYIVGLIFMIVVKVKYPKSKHGLILTIVYIAVGIFVIYWFFFLTSELFKCIDAVIHCPA